MTSEKKLLITVLLSLFGGVFGLHRFYVSKIGTAVTMLVLTLTFVGIIVTSIWAFIDLIMIASGNFKDKEGRYIKK